MIVKRRLFFRTGGVLLGVMFLLVTVSCVTTCSEMNQVEKKLETIYGMIEVGDDIHAARSRLLENGFYVTEIHFVTVEENSLSCSVRLVEYNDLDWFEYGVGKSMRPWRRDLPYNLVIKANTDGEIISLKER